MSWQHEHAGPGDGSPWAGEHLRAVFEEITPRRARFLTALTSEQTIQGAANRVRIGYETARSEVKHLRAITGSPTAWQLRVWWLAHASCGPITSRPRPTLPGLPSFG